MTPLMRFCFIWNSVTSSAQIAIKTSRRSGVTLGLIIFKHFSIGKVSRKILHPKRSDTKPYKNVLHNMLNHTKLSIFSEGPARSRILQAVQYILRTDLGETENCKISNIFYIRAYEVQTKFQFVKFSLPSNPDTLKFWNTQKYIHAIHVFWY